MKNKWLNLVLLLTNRIYQRKQEIIGQTGLGVIKNITALIFLEIFLGFLSIPLYLSMKSGKVTAFFSEKGTYEKVDFDYNLRRILTLTGVGIVAIIWIIKLSLIIFIPHVYGPLRLYTVSDLRPVDVINQPNLATVETNIETAKVVQSLARPVLLNVKKLKGGDYLFTGSGRPGTSVVLLLSDSQTAIYTTDVDEDGGWQITQAQSDFRLSDGNHAVVLFTYDPNLGTRSPVSDTQYFKSTSSFVDRLVKNVDTLANWSVVAIILLGIFLTLLTI